MSFLNSNRFQDRQAAAAQARKAMAVKEREAKRRAILEARVARDAERQRLRKEAEAAEAVRKAAEDVARLEALRQEGLALEAAEAARRAEEERLEYERKLDRDARYAARKERKKKAKSAFERFR